MAKAHSQKQRKIEGFTRDQRRNLFNIKKDIHKRLVMISYIEDKSKNPDKLKKSDLKKGNNANQGVKGIHSVNTINTYNDALNTMFTYFVRHFDLQSLGKTKKWMIEKYFNECITKYYLKVCRLKQLKVI